jgi:hypothetical protein
MQRPTVRIGLPVSRAVLGWLFAAVALVVTLIDGGSVVLTTLSVPDDALDAGHAAAKAVEGMASTQQTAVVAFDAARVVAAGHGLSVATDDFTIYPDGRVRLTVSRTAPTLLLHRVPALQDLVDVRATKTVGALPYS